MAAIAVAAVILLSGSSTSHSGSPYRHQLSGALAPVLSTETALASTLQNLSGNDTTTASNAASQAQTALDTAHGAVSVLKNDADYTVGLMRAIEPSESFGLGSAGFAQVAFKGGWGPEPDDQYGVRQTGIIGSRHSGIAVALTADPVSTFAAGQSVLDDMAQWLHGEVQLTPRRASGCPARVGR